MRFSSYEDNQEGQVACGEAAYGFFTLTGSVVSHGGNPLGASLSLWEKTELPHHSFASPTIYAHISGNIFYTFDASG
jgi:hypothetical protein